MICAEMPLAAAKDGLSPSSSTGFRRRGVPAFGIIASTVLASIAISHQLRRIAAGTTVFTTLVFMTGITAAIPYAFSALAQIKWRLADRRELHTPRFVRDMIVAVVVARVLDPVHLVLPDTGHSTFVTGRRSCCRRRAAAGIPVYTAQRTRMTEPGGRRLSVKRPPG